MRPGEMSGRNTDRGTKQAFWRPFRSITKNRRGDSMGSRPDGAQFIIEGLKSIVMLVQQLRTRPNAFYLVDLVFVQPHSGLGKHVFQIVLRGVPNARMHVADVPIE